MKAFFLDFNGVLDTYDNMSVICLENLNNLKKIIKETNAKVVISSSIKNTFFYNGTHCRVMKYLIDPFEKNGIEIY